MTSTRKPPEAEPGDMAAYARSKRTLVGSLSGQVLEIGAGRGANFDLLRSDAEWTGLEPGRRARRALGRAAAAHHRADRILTASAEALPLPDHSVDAVLSTIVLCSVRDQERTLAEIRRVLRPGGRFVFCEHVAAPARSGTLLAQRLWAPVSRWVDHGCDPARRTDRAISAAGFASFDLRWFTMRTFGLTVPFITGTGVA